MFNILSQITLKVKFLRNEEQHCLLPSLVMTSHVFIQKMHYSLTSCQLYFLVPLSSFLAHLLALSHIYKLKSTMPQWPSFSLWHDKYSLVALVQKQYMAVGSKSDSIRHNEIIITITNSKWEVNLSKKITYYTNYNKIIYVYIYILYTIIHTRIGLTKTVNTWAGPAKNNKNMEREKKMKGNVMD